ncbi:MAG TPA: hypothetical protein VM282_27970 [Acidimicrobiales bacterium]|nr:hypothetical protein [Acidimicrobiales bacterium]
MSDLAREFMRQRLGDDWEHRLRMDGAIVAPDATNEEADAAQQRAIELVSETSDDWTLELRELTTAAWQALRPR